MKKRIALSAITIASTIIVGCEMRARHVATAALVAGGDLPTPCRADLAGFDPPNNISIVTPYPPITEEHRVLLWESIDALHADPSLRETCPLCDCPATVIAPGLLYSCEYEGAEFWWFYGDGSVCMNDESVWGWIFWKRAQIQGNITP